MKFFVFTPTCASVLLYPCSFCSGTAQYSAVPGASPISPVLLSACFEKGTSSPPIVPCREPTPFAGERKKILIIPLLAPIIPDVPHSTALPVTASSLAAEKLLHGMCLTGERTPQILMLWGLVPIIHSLYKKFNSPFVDLPVAAVKCRQSVW